jgi:hypothetical protein
MKGEVSKVSKVGSDNSKEEGDRKDPAKGIGRRKGERDGKNLAI